MKKNETKVAGYPAELDQYFDPARSTYAILKMMLLWSAEDRVRDPAHIRLWWTNRKWVLDPNGTFDGFHDERGRWDSTTRYFTENGVEYLDVPGDGTEMQFNEKEETFEREIAYFDSEGGKWQTLLTINKAVYDWSISGWKRSEKICYISELDYNGSMLRDGIWVLNPKDQLIYILRKNYPYFAKYIEQEYIERGMNINLLSRNHLINMLQVPEMEQLLKAGYNAFDFILKRKKSETEYRIANQLIGKGTSLDEIFKVPRWLYKALKDEESIKVWDTFRKLNNRISLSPNLVDQIKGTPGMGEKEIELAANILKIDFHGKPIYTWQTLMHYLERLDMYEAIDTKEGLQLLDDYLHMCKRCGIEPKTDSDSLRREHDVTARLCQKMADEKRRAKMDKAMRAACEDLKANDYAETTFFIRGIRNFDDLKDEATQMHNCLIWYDQKIADKDAFVYVMREMAHPDKSLISIEIYKDGTMRQKWLAYNQPIKSKAQLSFIDRWLKLVKERMRNGNDHIDSKYDVPKSRFEEVSCDNSTISTNVA